MGQGPGRAEREVPRRPRVVRRRQEGQFHRLQAVPDRYAASVNFMRGYWRSALSHPRGGLRSSGEDRRRRIAGRTDGRWPAPRWGSGAWCRTERTRRVRSAWRGGPDGRRARTSTPELDTAVDDAEVLDRITLDEGIAHEDALLRWAQASATRLRQHQQQSSRDRAQPDPSGAAPMGQVDRCGCVWTEVGCAGRAGRPRPTTHATSRSRQRRAVSAAWRDDPSSYSKHHSSW